MDVDLVQSIAGIIKRYPEIRLFILFGSRARGEAKENSDWDFGYIAAKDFDSSALYSELTLHLQTDNLDLVDLTRTNGLLRFRAARDGVVIYQKTDEDYEKFWLEAVHFWCDAGPIIRDEYEALLKRL